MALGGQRRGVWSRILCIKSPMEQVVGMAVRKGGATRPVFSKPKEGPNQSASSSRRIEYAAQQKRDHPLDIACGGRKKECGSGQAGGGDPEIERPAPGVRVGARGRGERGGVRTLGRRK